MYIIVRKDLSPAQKAVQAAHAAIESTKSWPYKESHPHLVVLEVNNEEKLKKVLEKSRSNGILTTEFHESDVGLTAIATRPIVHQFERDIFKNYQLLK